MLKIINHPPARSNIWTIELHMGYSELPAYPSEEFGVAVGSIKENPAYCLGLFRGCRVAISVFEDLPHEFDYMAFIKGWYKAAKLCCVGSFFIQLTRIPEKNEGFPELITVDHTGEIHSQTIKIGIPYPHKV